MVSKTIILFLSPLLLNGICNAAERAVMYISDSNHRHSALDAESPKSMMFNGGIAGQARNDDDTAKSLQEDTFQVIFSFPNH